MKTRTALLLVTAALALAPTAGAASFRLVLTAPTHTPKVNAKWSYSVRATDLGGRLISATITTQIVDPFGGAHPVEFGDTTRSIVNFRFKGVFRDYIRFPSDSRGFRLTVRITVKAGSSKIVRSYWVKPV